MSLRDPEAILSAFQSVLREEREALGMTYEDAAAASGLHRTTLGLYERGERGPTIEAALKLAASLGKPLSELIRAAEERAGGITGWSPAYRRRREVPMDRFHKRDFLHAETGLTAESLRGTMLAAYGTLDAVDAQLMAQGGEPVAGIVELANLSSMIGNLLAAGLARASNGLYARNRPHTYPDLLPSKEGGEGLELKVALETNSPKGHLPKPGFHLIFRYVLCGSDGSFVRGKANRGRHAFIWEVKAGRLQESDFAISNTAGDSGKTAVVRTAAFNAMPLVFLEPELNPYASASGRYPGFN